MVITDFLFRVANHSWNLRSRWRFLFAWPMRCGEFLLEVKNSEQSYLQNSVWWGAWRIGVNVSRFMWNKVSIVKEADLANHLQYKYFKISSLYSSCQTEAIVEAFIAIAWDKFLRTFTRSALQKIVSLMKFGFNWIISHNKKVQLLDWVFRILLTVFNGMNEKKRCFRTKQYNCMLLPEHQFSCRSLMEILQFSYLSIPNFFSLFIEWFRKPVVEGTAQTLSR